MSVAACTTIAKGLYRHFYKIGTIEVRIRNKDMIRTLHRTVLFVHNETKRRRRTKINTLGSICQFAVLANVGLFQPCVNALIESQLLDPMPSVLYQVILNSLSTPQLPNPTSFFGLAFPVLHLVIVCISHIIVTQFLNRRIAGCELQLHQPAQARFSCLSNKVCISAKSEQHNTQAKPSFAI